MARASGCLQTLIGLAIMGVGVPLLVLPGPGLLLMFAGAALAARGASRLLGRDRRDRTGDPGSFPRLPR
jgi:hypothetical protein